MTTTTSEPGLRERKHARTKLALLDAFVAAMEQKPIEEIAVRELCATVPVSEATFFNYFRGKADLVTYFVQLWSLDHAWHATRTLEREGALAALHEIFARTATTVREHPRVMAEVLAAQARYEGPVVAHEIGLAERRERFAELGGIDALPALGLDSLLPWLLEEAVRRGELSEEAPRELLFLTLAAVFFGTPIALLRVHPEAVGEAWSAQLELLLAPHRVRRTASKGGPSRPQASSERSARSAPSARAPRAREPRAPKASERKEKKR